MGSTGTDLARWERQGLLHIDSSRPTLHGLDQDLVHMHELVRDDRSLKPTLMRPIDYLKQRGVTALFTSLTSDSHADVADTKNACWWASTCSR